MKEKNYRLNFRKTLVYSWPVWLAITTQLGLNLLYIINSDESKLFGLIILNIFLALQSIPGLFMHFSHLAYAKEAILTINGDSTTYSRFGKETVLKNSEICKVNHHALKVGLHAVSWIHYSWFELVDKQGKSIKVSCYLLEFQDFWIDNLSLKNKVSTDVVLTERSLLPVMK